VEIPGWALNLSRGGLRAVVEERVALGEELGVRIDEIQIERPGRVVWAQEEPDGTIVGISFLERIEAPPPGVNFETSSEITQGDLAAKLGLSVAQLRAALDDTDPAATASAGAADRLGSASAGAAGAGARKPTAGAEGQSPPDPPVRPGKPDDP
jgi:hypothetical protein